MRSLLAGGLPVMLLWLCCVTAFAQTDSAAAQQAFARGDYQAAKSEYFSLAAHSPDDGAAWLGLARSCCKLEQWDEALTAYERAATLDALDSAARVEYGDLLKQQGQLDAAIAQYKLALSAGDSVSSEASSSQAGDPPKSANAAEKPAAKPVKNTATKKANVKKADPKKPAVPDAVASKKPATAAAKTHATKETVGREIPVKPAQPQAAPELTDTTITDSSSDPGAANHHDANEPRTLSADGHGTASSASQEQSGLVQVFRQPLPPVLTVQQDTPPAPAAPATPRDMLSQARDLAASNRWAEAVTAYEEYLKQGAAGDDIHLEYADALREAGSLQQAEDEFNRLIHTNPDNVEAKIGLAKVLGRNKKITEAMYLLDQIFVDKTTYAKVQLARAYVYAVNDYISEAISMIGEVQSYEPDNAEAKELLREYTAKQDTEKGWNVAGPLPDDPSLAGEILFQRGDTAAAKTSFEKALKANPADKNAWERLATLYRWDSQWNDAIEAYLHYLKLNPTDYSARLAYAQALLNAGQPQEARDELWSLITDPTTPIEVYNETLLAYATALTACGQAKEALTWYEQAIRFDPHNAGALTSYASALAAARKYREAQEQYNLVLQEDPGNQAARLGLAQTYAWSGDTKTAIQYYNDIGSSSEYYSAGLIGKAFAYLWSGQRGKAIALAAEAGRADPNNPDLQTLYLRLNEKPDPQLTAMWQQSHDSDGNSNRNLVGTLNIPLDAKGTVLGVRHEDIRLDNKLQNMNTDGTNTTLSLSLPVGSKMRLYGSAGKINLNNSNATKSDKWNWSAAMHVDLRDWWTASVAFEDRTLYDTAELARNEISVGEWTTTSDWTLRDNNTHIVAQYSHGKLSDGNSRDSKTLKVARSAQWQNRGRLDYGADYRTLDYSWDVSHGYWDPDNYRIYEAFADWMDTSDRRIKLDGGLGVGMQKNTDTKFSGVYRYTVGLRAGFHGDRMIVRGGYTNSNAQNSASSVPGFQAKSWYLAADFRF